MIVGPDVSFYQDDDTTSRRIDFVKMRAAGAKFVFIRVGQNTWIDPDFTYNWVNAKAAGLLRGAYWMVDGRNDNEVQADLFVDTVGGDVPELPYVFDLEEPGLNVPFGGFLNWKKHIIRLESRVGLAKMMGYSRATFINERNLDAAAIAFLHRYPWWFAHYYDPPVPDVPMGWAADEWLFHQYTDRGDGLLYGVESSRIDLNRFNGDLVKFEALFGMTEPQPPAPPETPVQTHQGVELYALSRFGAPTFVQVIDPKVADVWVSGRADDFQQVGQTIAKNNASGGTNGGGWPYGSTYANEIWKSQGVLLQASAKDDRPWVGFTDTREIVFGRGVPASNVTDVVGYDRYVIENGVLNERYRYNTVKDARTFSGRRPDGKFILCACEGNDVHNYGLTFWEEGLVLQEFGCTTGGNHDGGSSSTIINTALGADSLNIPSDGEQAYVINAILWRAEPVTNPPVEPPGETMIYEVILPVKPRPQPSLYSSSSRLNLPAGTTFESAVTKIVNELDESNTWVQMPDGYWVPLTAHGTVYVQAQEPPPAPPTTKVFTLTVEGYRPYSGVLEPL